MALPFLLVKLNDPPESKIQNPTFYILFLVFVGAYVAFFGHRSFTVIAIIYIGLMIDRVLMFVYFLQASQFIFGAYGTGMCTFIIIAVINEDQLDNYTQQIGLAIAIGIIGGIVCLVMWCFLGIPILSASIPVALLGLLFGSCFVFLPPMNIISLSNDVSFI